MVLRSKPMSRRTLLRGAGVALALPGLEAMAPRTSHAGSGGSPVRLLAYYVPNGMVMSSWTPPDVPIAHPIDVPTGLECDANRYPSWPEPGARPLTELSTILEPLAPVQDRCLVLTGLDNAVACGGGHAVGTMSFLTGRAEDGNIGPSVDQIAAAEIGSETLFRSLEAGVEGMYTSEGRPSSHGGREISWSGPGTPMAKETDPAALFDRVFMGFSPEPDLVAERRRRYRLSVIDFVLDDANALRDRLGRDDRQKVAEYLDGIRDLERRLEQPPGACEIPEPPVADAAYPERIRTLLDLLALAFQCDLTRIATFMQGESWDGRKYSFLGGELDWSGECRDSNAFPTEDRCWSHHIALSHNRRQAPFRALYEKVNVFSVENLAYLAQRLDAMDEGDGTTVLDNTMLFFSSEIGDGEDHTHLDLPIVLVGGGGGTIAGGRHMVYAQGTPRSRLFVSMLNALGVEVNTFGVDGDGPLSGLDG